MGYFGNTSALIQCCFCVMSLLWRLESISLNRGIVREMGYHSYCVLWCSVHSHHQFICSFHFQQCCRWENTMIFFFIYILSTYPYMKLTVFSSVRSSSYQDWYSLKILWSKKKWKNHVLEDVDKYCKCRGSKKCLHVSGVSLSGALIFCLPSGIGKFPKDYLIVLYFTYKKIVALTVLESAAMYVFPCLSLSCHF